MTAGLAGTRALYRADYTGIDPALPARSAGGRRRTSRIIPARTAQPC